jgi:phosphoribosylformylglycinamidine cyclo-ligase
MTSATPGNLSDNAGGITYASAGVDVEAGDLAVELMKGAVKATHNSSVIGGVGGFAGLYDVSRLLTYKRHRRRGHQGCHRPGHGHPRHHRL